MGTQVGCTTLKLSLVAMGGIGANWRREGTPKCWRFSLTSLMAPMLITEASKACWCAMLESLWPGSAALNLLLHIQQQRRNSSPIAKRWWLERQLRPYYVWFGGRTSRATPLTEWSMVTMLQQLAWLMVSQLPPGALDTSESVPVFWKRPWVTLRSTQVAVGNCCTWKARSLLRTASQRLCLVRLIYIL